MKLGRPVDRIGEWACLWHSLIARKTEGEWIYRYGLFIQGLVQANDTAAKQGEEVKLAFVLLTATLGWAQVPTISNIVVANVTHNSVRLTFTASPNTSWVSCLLGTVSGTYTAQRCPNYPVNNASDHSTASFSLGGLKPSTTYYIRPTAQPNQTNQTNICNADGCGASEQTFTTSADPALPVVPAPPTAYSVPNPDTSAYTVVRMVAGAIPGVNECKANASIGTVTAGDTVQTVLNEITLGYVLEFDQGITCPVPNTNTNNGGYILPSKSSGSGYVVIRTKTIASSDFPPFGTRTSPALCSKCATFKSTVQNTDIYTTGQTFTSGNPGPNNYIIQNVILTVDQTINTGTWGQMVGFGANTNNPGTDNVVLDRVVILGSNNRAVGTEGAVTISAAHAAVVNSWIAQIWDPTRFATGIFGSPTGTGPYTIDNNYIECACMTFYNEQDNGFNVPANDVTLTHNTFYWPAALINGNTFLLRQQIEFKGGHRILIQGNLIDGCWSYQNECPAIFASGVNDWVANDGVSDMNVNYNLVRNAATFFDCMGVRPPGNSDTPQNNVNQRIWVSNNWGYNLGLGNHATANAPGATNGYIVMGPGCEDLTVTQNTFGFTDPHDTRAGSTLDWIPFIYRFSGGATLAANFTHTNNIEYVNYGSGPYNGGRIFADRAEINPSYPSSPTIVYNTNAGTNTPKQILDSYSVQTTNGTVTPSYAWSGNINICGQIDAGSNVWSDQTSGQCTTTRTGMPSTGSGDTWVTGNTIAEREANVGFNRTTGICSGCGGAGADIGALYSTMQVVTEISVAFSGTSAIFAYTAPDTRACDVDTSLNGSTWTRHVDAGGSRARTMTVTGLSGTSFYRILCYFSQTAPLFSGSQLTDGILTAGTASTPCDLNMDGVTNVMDVQLMVNMSLGTIPCTANISGAGKCSVVEVQRVVNASLQGVCVTGQ